MPVLLPDIEPEMHFLLSVYKPTLINLLSTGKRGHFTNLFQALVNANCDQSLLLSVVFKAAFTDGLGDAKYFMRPTCDVNTSSPLLSHTALHFV
jgi:hypothetical protein